MENNFDSSIHEDRLNTEDKIRIFKGMILIFFFSTVGNTTNQITTKLINLFNFS